MAKPDWKPPISMHVLFWPPSQGKGALKPLPNTMFQGILLRPNTEIEWWHVRQTTHCPTHWFSIVSGSSKPGKPSNLPFSYHSNPFLRKVIVKRRRFLTNLVVGLESVSYTHLRAHETDSYLVCRLLLEKKNSGFLFVCFCGELVSAPLLNTLAISLFQCSCSAMAKEQTPPIDRPLVLSYRSQPEWQAGLKPPNLHACVVLTPMLLSPPPG